MQKKPENLGTEMATDKTSSKWNRRQIDLNLDERFTNQLLFV